MMFMSKCPYCDGSIIFKDIVYNAGIPIVRWQCSCCHKISPFYRIKTSNRTDDTNCEYITTNTSSKYYTSNF